MLEAYSRIPSCFLVVDDFAFEIQKIPVYKYMAARHVKIQERFVAVNNIMEMDLLVLPLIHLVFQYQYT